MFDLKSIVRPTVLQLQPYSSARDEFEGGAEVYLDANENPYSNGLNRYPDPRQRALKGKISGLWSVPIESIFLGNGSDEAIDLLVRAFCEPGQDEILVCPPTYGMYQVTAAINNVKLKKVPLDAGFNIDEEKVIANLENPRLKLIFLCSPNNPTGNLMDAGVVGRILKKFKGMVVVDEAYVDFSPEGSLIGLLESNPNPNPNLVVLRTFSKAWGMAGLRLGAALGSTELIGIMNRIKPPYNVSELTQQKAMELLENKEEMLAKVDEMNREREILREVLLRIPGVDRVFSSSANFLLVAFKNAGFVFQSLREQGIVVRDRRKEVPNCLRISIGTPLENRRLLNQLEQLLVPNVSIH